MRTFIACVLSAALAAMASVAIASQSTSWTKLRVGQTAYLGASLTEDNDPSLRPICTTLDELRDTIRPSGRNCPKDRHVGDVVVVTDIGPALGESSGTAVAVRSRDGAWTGWLEAATLEPIIPVGTRIVFTKSGNADIDIMHHEDNASQMKEGVGTDLGSPVTVVLLHQDPPSGAGNLHVRVLTGPKAGMTGWILPADGVVEGTRQMVDALS
jgi:hypothetical protein